MRKKLDFIIIIIVVSTIIIVAAQKSSSIDEHKVVDRNIATAIIFWSSQVSNIFFVMPVVLMVGVGEF